MMSCQFKPIDLVAIFAAGGGKPVIIARRSAKPIASLKWSAGAPFATFRW